MCPPLSLSQLPAKADVHKKQRHSMILRNIEVPVGLRQSLFLIKLEEIF